MCPPIPSPPSFPSILDALLHYYPLNSSPLARTSPVSPTHAGQTRTRNVSTPHGTAFEQSPKSASSRFLHRQPTIRVPTPHINTSGHRHMQSSPNPPKSPATRERMAGLSKSFQDADYFGLSPSAAGRSQRLSPSPSRHYGLSALSPLQAFSPLPTPSALPKEKSSRSSNAGTDSPKTHTRSSSLTRSLSRRQSLIANAEKWSRGDEHGDRGDVESLFSRITLVKAPAEETTLKR